MIFKFKFYRNNNIDKNRSEILLLVIRLLNINLWTLAIDESHRLFYLYIFPKILAFGIVHKNRKPGVPIGGETAPPMHVAAPPPPRHRK